MQTASIANTVRFAVNSAKSPRCESGIIPDSLNENRCNPLHPRVPSRAAGRRSPHGSESRLAARGRRAAARPGPIPRQERVGGSESKPEAMLARRQGGAVLRRRRVRVMAAPAEAPRRPLHPSPRVRALDGHDSACAACATVCLHRAWFARGRGPAAIVKGARLRPGRRGHGERGRWGGGGGTGGGNDRPALRDPVRLRATGLEAAP